MKLHMVSFSFKICMHMVSYLCKNVHVYGILLRSQMVSSNL